MKRDERTDNDLEDITKITKDRATRMQLKKSKVELRCVLRKGQAVVHAPNVTLFVFLL